MGWIPELGRSAGAGNGQPTPAFLPGKSHGQRSLGGHSPWSHRQWDTAEHKRVLQTVLYIELEPWVSVLFPGKTQSLEPKTKIIPAYPVLNLSSLSAPSVFTCRPGHCPVSTPPALHELFPLFKLPLSAWSSSHWILVAIKNAAHVFPVKEATQAGWRACPLIPKYLLHLDTVYAHDSFGTVDCSPPGFLAMGFSRQESWSRFPFLSQVILPAPGIWPSSLGSPSLAGASLSLAPPGKPETPLETSKA